MRVLVPLRRDICSDDEDNKDGNQTKEPPISTSSSAEEEDDSSLLVEGATTQDEQQYTVAETELKVPASVVVVVTGNPTSTSTSSTSTREQTKDQQHQQQQQSSFSPQQQSRTLLATATPQKLTSEELVYSKNCTQQAEPIPFHERKRKAVPHKKTSSSPQAKRRDTTSSSCTGNPVVNVGDLKPPARATTATTKMGLYVRPRRSNEGDDHGDDRRELPDHHHHLTSAQITSSATTSSSNIAATHSRRRNQVTRANNDPALVSEAREALGMAEEMDTFVLGLKKVGLEIQEQEGDGNCLFRAVSLQVYGDPSMHGDVRKQCLNFMERDRQHFSQFVTGEPFEQYLQRKKQDGVHGNNPEIQAISELFNRPVEVYCPENGASPINIFHADYKTGDTPIRLSYHDGNHYNAVINPLVPTAGLGLGLPGLQPGLADKMQVAKAVAASDAAADQEDLQRVMKKSEDDELQRAIKESSLCVEHDFNKRAMNLSDIDATYLELEQTALENSLRSQTTPSGSGKKQQVATIPRASRSQGTIETQAYETKESKRASLSSEPTTAAASAACLAGSFDRDDQSAYVPVAAAAAAASVASMPSAASVAAASATMDDTISTNTSLLSTADEYPRTVQELAMNGFPLQKVVKAYELIGDNFDELICFLMSTTSATSS